MAFKLLPTMRRHRSPQLLLHKFETSSLRHTQRCAPAHWAKTPQASKAPFSSSCIAGSRIQISTKPRKPPQCLNAAPSRLFTTTRPQNARATLEQVKSRNRSGPFSWKAAALFILTGAGMIVYFRYEKARLERKRIVEMSKGVGKPKVGGPFELTDIKGNKFTEESLKGKYNIIYFGFTHCPDICPDELDKMSRAIDIVTAKHGPVLRPIFISCDPARDTPLVLRQYLDEFHPKLIGLTGTYEQTKHVCKMYRVYFSTPENVKPGEDYLVDHSIYFYVMDPDGDFVECIGRQDTPESAAQIMSQHISDWKGKIDRTEE